MSHRVSITLIKVIVGRVQEKLYSQLVVELVCVYLFAFGLHEPGTRRRNSSCARGGAVVRVGVGCLGVGIDGWLRWTLAVEHGVESAKVIVSLRFSDDTRPLPLEGACSVHVIALYSIWWSTCGRGSRVNRLRCTNRRGVRSFDVWRFSGHALVAEKIRRVLAFKLQIMSVMRTVSTRSLDP